MTEAGFQVTVLSSHLSVPLLMPSLLIFSPLKEGSDFSSVSLMDNLKPISRKKMGHEIG